MTSSSDHLIQTYTDDAHLGAVVADHIASGLQCRQGVVIVATPGHVALFSDRLGGSGIDVGAALAGRQLLFLDAAQTLTRLMAGGTPDRKRFLAIVGEAMNHVRAAGPRGFRLYGEMVDLLWRQSLAATLTLEALWEEMLRDEPASLLCAYRLNPLDRHAPGVLRAVTQCHSRLLPAEAPECFERAVDRAYAEVFGAGGEVETLREFMVRGDTLTTAMTDAHAALFALDTLPRLLANDVRARAHRYYAGGLASDERRPGWWSVPHAACWTARQGVGAQAEPPTIECASPVTKNVARQSRPA